MSTNRPGYVLLVIGVGTFLSALAASAVTLALPAIGRDLAIDLRASQWVLQSMLLTTTALLLLAGRLGDLVGHRRLYLGGFAAFGAASLVCGLAPDFGWLLAGRVLQGIGAALMMACSPALLTLSSPPQERGKALGILATATYGGLTFGPPVGGLLVGALGWRWVFLLNVPVAVAVLALGFAFLPGDQRQRARLDLPGTAALVIGLPLLLMAVSQGRSWGWASAPTLLCLGAGLAGLAAFLVVEDRHPSPLLDLSLFRSTTFTGAAASAVLNYICLFIPILLMPFFLTEGLGLSDGRAGLLLMAQPLLMALVAGSAGALSDRVGTRPLATGGMVVMAIALAWMATVSQDTAVGWVAARLALLGLGTGIFISPNSSALMGAAPRQRQGIAGGVMAVSRNLGMLCGVAAAAALFHGLGGETGRSWIGEDFAALRGGMWVAAGLALLGAATAFVGQRPSAAEPVS
jgi:EmrB/QacA subfamily drug resistance transporter